MKAVDNIVRKLGDGLAMPGPDVLSKASLDELMSCKVGFRAKYILNAAENAIAGNLVLDGKTDITTEDLRRCLMKIKGVGVKVADCVMLFSYGRREVFPIDVWIGRIMRRLYFGGADVGLTEIQDFAKERFGEYAGYANQLLFHYARMNKIV